MLVAVPLVDVAALQFLLGRRAQGDPLDLELQLRPRQRMIEIQTHRVIRHILNAGITRVAFFVGVIVFSFSKINPPCGGSGVCREGELNSRPRAYESLALPLSYLGVVERAPQYYYGIDRLSTQG